jgi:hypothetical protein
MFWLVAAYVDDADAVRNEIDDPYFVLASHGDRNGLEADRNRLEVAQLARLDLKHFQAIVWRVDSEQEVAARRQR